jgi:hypothetical protein
MRFELLILFIVLACSHQSPYRRVAQDLSEFRVGEVSFKRSLVQVFPSDTENNFVSYYLFVQLKDSEGRFVDAERREFSLRTHTGEEINFKFERVLPGRYYLTLEKEESRHWKKLNLYLQDKPLKEQFKVQMVKASETYSKMTKVKNSDNRLVLRLNLRDQHNKPLELPEPPEIFLEGDGEMPGIIHTGEGVWEFTIIYPNHNQIIYVSARANGFLLKRLYRYQHIEK